MLFILTIFYLFLLRISEERFSSIWGGASLLQMHLSTLRQVLAMYDWSWDYFINLSETDVLIRPLDDLTAFLTRNRGKVFLR